MKAKTKLRLKLIELTGYWIFKHKDIPVGCDLATDLTQRIPIPLNTIFDVGANIGQTVRKFSEYFPQAQILSFEPVSGTFEKLKAAVKDVKGVRCYQLALGDKEGPVDINIFPEKTSDLNSLNVKAMNNKEDFRVETILETTGDKFCAENNISEIDLLKIDTEGYELPVLKGFSGMIRSGKVNAIYCETGFSPNNSRNTFLNDLITFAIQNDFSFYGLYDVNNFLIRYGNHFGNALFIRNEMLKRLLKP